MTDVPPIGNQGLDVVHEGGGGGPEHGHVFELGLCAVGIGGRGGGAVVVVPV